MVDTAYTTFYKGISVTSTTADADADVVYTVPANHDAELSLLVISNGGSTRDISIQVYHADTSDYCYLLRSHSVAGNESYTLLGPERLHLHAGDKILTYKSSSGDFDVSVSGKQFYNPARS